jgi:general secretion pathway protein A
MSDKHKEGLASLKYGVMENKGFLVLTGDIGTGKTLLINALIRITEVKALIATIPDPDLEIRDFFMLLAEEFNMPKTFASKGEFLVQFKQFLMESYVLDKTVLLIIDEAQRLNSELLEQIRLLSNIELDNRKLLNIFFVGQSEFNQLLMNDRNKAVRQRIGVFYQLKPLAESDTGGYIHHRLKKAGATEEIFKPSAIQEIFNFSKGTPRLINVICDLALLTGFTLGLKKINATVIKDCAKELQIPTELAEVSPKTPKLSQDFGTLNPAAAQQEEPGGIRGGLIFIGILFFLFVAYQIYESVTDKPLFRKQEQVESKKKFEPPLDVSNAFKTQKKELENTKSEPSEVLDSPEKPENPQSDVLLTKDTEKSLANKQFTQPSTTPTNTAVDQKTVIYFDHNSNELPQKAYKTLNDIVKLTSQRPNLKITVEGYTDSHGNAVYNKQLSQYRADMVKNYLIGNGIAPAQISAHGRGTENPMEPNVTVEGRRQNRRVEIRVNTE